MSTKIVKVDSFGWARLTIPSKGVDLTVQAPGYKTLRRQRVRDHLTIELKKEDALSRVEVKIEGGLPKKIPANLWLELVPSGTGGKRIQAKSFSLDGCYYFYEVPPGSYRVRVVAIGSWGMSAETWTLRRRFRRPRSSKAWVVPDLRLRMGWRWLGAGSVPTLTSRGVALTDATGSFRLETKKPIGGEVHLSVAHPDYPTRVVPVSFQRA